jgi:hypothetical protein
MPVRPAMLAARRRGVVNPSEPPASNTGAGALGFAVEVSGEASEVGYSWLQNLPSGYVSAITPLTFTTGTDGAELASGFNAQWGYNRRSATITYQIDATKPFSGTLGTGTGQWNYTAGMGAGNNDPGVVGPSIGFSTNRIYVAYLIKHQNGFVPQNPGVKMSHFFFANGQNIHLDSYHPQPGFVEAYSGVAGEWVPGPTGWDGGPNGPAFWRYSFPTVQNGIFNNVSRPAAQVKRNGEWQMIELFMDFPAGIMRQWVDGVLTADWSTIVYPATTITIPADSAGTFGGGSVTLSASQWWRMGACAIYVPG